MTDPMTVAELAAVVAGSFSLALWLEWLCLRGLFGLMPQCATSSRSRPRKFEGRRVSAASPRLLIRPDGRAGLHR